MQAHRARQFGLVPKSHPFIRQGRALNGVARKKTVTSSELGPLGIAPGDPRAPFLTLAIEAEASHSSIDPLLLVIERHGFAPFGYHIIAMLIIMPNACTITQLIASEF